RGPADALRAAVQRPPADARRLPAVSRLPARSPRSLCVQHPGERARRGVPAACAFRVRRGRAGRGSVIWSADTPGDFIGRTFSAPAARTDRMRDIVLGHVPRDRAIRLLDIGCGTGSLLYRLADPLPSAVLVGIDISPANIRAAKEQQAARAPAARLEFEAADYLAYRAEPFDAIVADGVLHLVPGDTTALVRKLAGDLREGG